MMLTILCVLKSGGEYAPLWVERLKRAVSRHLSVEHAFKCLSDVDVPCERIPLKHGWPGWWSKIELFRPDVVTGPTLYLDLDTVIVGSIDELSDFSHDFAIMRNFHQPWMPGSAVMWFRKPQTHVYEIFSEQPEAYIAQFAHKSDGCYMGDQAFIWEAMNRRVKYLSDDVPGLIRSYRRHCQAGVPQGCSVVAFGGSKRPWNVHDHWVKEAIGA